MGYVHESNRWVYTGDRDLSAGGVFLNMRAADWRYGYVDAVEVTDLDSACGATGMVLIERRTVYGMDDRKRIAEALRCCGLLPERREPIEGQRGASRSLEPTPAEWAAFAREHRPEHRRDIIAESLMRYGYSDPADYDAGEVLQGDPEEPWTFDGFTAQRHVADSDLAGYVRARYLDGASCQYAPEGFETADARRSRDAAETASAEAL